MIGGQMSIEENSIKASPRAKGSIALVLKPHADGRDGLFAEWYYLEYQRLGSQKAVLEAINDKCGTSYKSNWIAMQTERGTSRTPPVVRREMMLVVLRHRLKNLGITDAKVVINLVNALL